MKIFNRKRLRLHALSTNNIPTVYSRQHLNVHWNASLNNAHCVQRFRALSNESSPHSHAFSPTSLGRFETWVRIGFEGKLESCSDLTTDWLHNFVVTLLTWVLNSHTGGHNDSPIMAWNYDSDPLYWLVMWRDPTGSQYYCMYFAPYSLNISNMPVNSVTTVRKA